MTGSPASRDRVDYGGRPTLTVQPDEVLWGNPVVVRGSGWGRGPVQVQVDGRQWKGVQVAQGLPTRRGVQPDPTGGFVFRISTLGLAPGSRRLSVSSARPEAPPVEVEIRIHPRAEPGPDAEEDAFWRQVDGYWRRFGHLGFIPPGLKRAQVGAIRRLREERARKQRGGSGPVVVLSAPDPLKSNWTPVGAGPSWVVTAPSDPVLTNSGRIRCIAIHPTDSSIVYVGTANGGVWKTTTTGQIWQPISDYADTLAIGALAIDPGTPDRIVAGTGELPGFQLYYAGQGLLVFEPGQESPVGIGVAEFEHESISTIRFDPVDPTRMLVASTKGVYEITRDGSPPDWTIAQLRAGMARNLVLVRDNDALAVIAGFYGDGLWTSTRTNGPWGAWTKIESDAFPDKIDNIALSQGRGTSEGVIYAAFGAAALAGMARSHNGGHGWTSVPVGDIVSSQAEQFAGAAAAHTLALTVQDLTTVFYGGASLWKTENAGSKWVRAIGLHGDVNMVALDPSTGGVVWAADDGGAWRSEDGGQTWNHRNLGLGTLQFVRIASHPLWDAILLGGTQDNGVLRAAGHPMWTQVDGGDAGFCVIHPKLPTRMYHGERYQIMARSDDSATTWVDTSDVDAGTPLGQDLTEPSLFYPPFAVDPGDPEVCYFGAQSLWRSADGTTSWKKITDPLPKKPSEALGFKNGITSINLSPGDPQKIYVGTAEGTVFRITQAAGIATTKDVTGTGLPGSVCIAALAADSTGNVWAAIGSIFYDDVKADFSGAHVYRLASGSTKWESFSQGLPDAVPINALVIDPGSKGQRIFCAGDVGVYRLEKALEGSKKGVWELWDEGLPGSPVFDLVIHEPSRLLRAATHGRSVWERPIDKAVGPRVDLYLRDNVLDTGRVSTASGAPHPFKPGELVWPWQSADVKVDSHPFQSEKPAVDYALFEGRLFDESQFVPRDEKVRVHVQVHNRGPFPATKVRIRAFFAEAHAALPQLPADFWPNAFDGNPSADDWTPVGSARTIDTVWPGQPAVVVWERPAWEDADEHSCILALATCEEDPLEATELDVAELVTKNKRATLKNLHILGPPPAPGPVGPTPDGESGAGDSASVLRFHNSARSAGRFDVVIHWGSLPPEARLFVAFEGLSGGGVIPGSAAILARGGVRVARPEDASSSSDYTDRRGRVSRFPPEQTYELVPRGGRRSVFRDVRIPARDSLVGVVAVRLPDGWPGTAQFDVVQQRGKRVLGGSTYVVRRRRRGDVARG
jgi:hypothetical protein